MREQGDGSMHDSIVVTGGAGFIGSSLCKKLLEKGYRVIAIDNFNDFYSPGIKRKNIQEVKTAAGNRPNSFKLYQGDIRDISFLQEVFENNSVDCIVHLAAYAGVRPSVENPKLYSDVNINGTINLLEISKDWDINHFIFGSSSSVYGNNKKAPFKESDTTDKPVSPYAATKKSGELLCHTYHALYGISTACLRLFSVYGPGQRPDLAIHKFTRLILEKQEIPIYGDGTTVRDYTFIDDIVDGIIRCIEWIRKGNCRYEIFNLGAGRTITLNNVVKTIEEVLCQKVRLKIMPKQPGDVDKTYADISKAKTVLGYNPSTDFKSGIKNFIDWYRDTFNAGYKI